MGIITTVLFTTKDGEVILPEQEISEFTVYVA